MMICGGWEDDVGGPKGPYVQTERSLECFLLTFSAQHLRQILRWLEAGPICSLSGGTANPMLGRKWTNHQALVVDVEN